MERVPHLSVLGMGPRNFDLKGRSAGMTGCRLRAVVWRRVPAFVRAYHRDLLTLDSRRPCVLVDEDTVESLGRAPGTTDADSRDPRVR